MTKKEAIKRIKDHIQVHKIGDYPHIYLREALDMAIEALEKQIPNINADRIRNMSNDELADFFFESPEIEFEVCEYCKNFGGRMSDTPCKHDMGLCYIADKNEAFKKWLQQPYKD